MKDPKYINHIRSLPCVVTGFSPCVAHHVIVGNEIGRLPKDDTVLVPLWPPLHNELNDSIHFISEREVDIPEELKGQRLTKNQLFKIKHGIDLFETAIRLREEYDNCNS